MLLVDAANVVGSRPDGWWRDRPGAAARLVAALQQLQQLPPDAGPVVVVLEGQARPGAAETDEGPVQVVHAAGEGDDTLAELAGPGVVLVTADRELRERARARGADVQGPGWLLDQIPY